MSSTQIARRCFVTRQSLADVLAVLRSAGLVVPDATTGGRARPMTLSPAGRAGLEAAEASMMLVEERMVAGLSTREVATLVELLRVWAANLE